MCILIIRLREILQSVIALIGKEALDLIALNDWDGSSKISIDSETKIECIPRFYHKEPKRNI